MSTRARRGACRRCPARSCMVPTRIPGIDRRPVNTRLIAPGLVGERHLQAGCAVPRLDRASADPPGDERRSRGRHLGDAGAIGGQHGDVEVACRCQVRAAPSACDHRAGDHRRRHRRPHPPAVGRAEVVGHDRHRAVRQLRQRRGDRARRSGRAAAGANAWCTPGGGSAPSARCRRRRSARRPSPARPGGCAGRGTRRCRAGTGTAPAAATPRSAGRSSIRRGRSARRAGRRGQRAGVLHRPGDGSVELVDEHHDRVAAAHRRLRRGGGHRVASWRSSSSSRPYALFRRIRPTTMIGTSSMTTQAPSVNFTAATIASTRTTARADAVDRPARCASPAP